MHEEIGTTPYPGFGFLGMSLGGDTFMIVGAVELDRVGVLSAVVLARDRPHHLVREPARPAQQWDELPGHLEADHV